MGEALGRKERPELQEFYGLAKSEAAAIIDNLSVSPYHHL